MEMRSRGLLWQWPGGLLTEMAACILVVVASSPIALRYTGILLLAFGAMMVAPFVVAVFSAEWDPALDQSCGAGVIAMYAAMDVSVFSTLLGLAFVAILLAIAFVVRSHPRAVSSCGWSTVTDLLRRCSSPSRVWRTWSLHVHDEPGDAGWTRSGLYCADVDRPA